MSRSRSKLAPPFSTSAKFLKTATEYAHRTDRSESILRRRARVVMDDYVLLASTLTRPRTSSTVSSAPFVTDCDCHQTHGAACTLVGNFKQNTLFWGNAKLIEDDGY